MSLRFPAPAFVKCQGPGALPGEEGAPAYGPDPTSAPLPGLSENLTTPSSTLPSLLPKHMNRLENR